MTGVAFVRLFPPRVILPGYAGSQEQWNLGVRRARRAAKFAQPLDATLAACKQRPRGGRYGKPSAP